MIQSLTSWRSIFALMIFMHHFYVGNQSLFSEGYLGVSFFFILSGFVLSYNYGKVPFTIQNGIRFVLKRISKLYPLHILCFCITLLLFDGVFHCVSSIINVLLLQSWIPKASYYFSYNVVSWCLSDELFFYICFPFIGYCLFRMTLKKQIIGILLTAIFLVLIAMLVPERYHHFLFYICPLVRLSDFILGIVLCTLYKYLSCKKIVAITKRNATIYETISLIVLILFILCSSYVPQVYRYGLYYWIPMSFMIGTFAYFNICKGYISLILSQQLFVKFGAASFCFYMIHVLCIHCMQCVISYCGFNICWQVSFIIILIVTAILSLLCYQYFESPINRYLRKKID